MTSPLKHRGEEARIATSSRCPSLLASIEPGAERVKLVFGPSHLRAPSALALLLCRVHYDRPTRLGLRISLTWWSRLGRCHGHQCQTTQHYPCHSFCGAQPIPLHHLRLLGWQLGEVPPSIQKRTLRDWRSRTAVA